MNKICKECKQENEPEYNYCKNCGNKLDSDVKIKEENTAQNINYSKYSNPFGDIGVEEISAEELSLFIGKKSNDILPKFQKMELTNSKISWCWPVAILSLIFGPFAGIVSGFIGGGFRALTVLWNPDSVFTAVACSISTFLAGLDLVVTLGTSSTLLNSFIILNIDLAFLTIGLTCLTIGIV